MDVIKEIAVYCRVSSEDQAEYGYNLREQERRIEQYLQVYEDEFQENVVKYIDDGYSARTLKRREMKVLINDIQQGKIGKVVIHNLDRLTRSVTDLMYLLELFNEFDVQLYSLKEKIDTTSAIGRFFVSMIILVAQWETEAISERTIRGMDQSAYEGNWVHGKAPYGYDIIDKKLVINEREAAIVKEAHYLYYYEFKNRSEIKHLFNNKHRKEAFVWTDDRIRVLLNNVIYKGTYQNSRIVIEEHSPVIIEPKLFDDVQLALSLRNKRSQYPYLFKGKCYDFKSGEMLTVKPTKKDMGYYLYYKTMDGKYINEDIIAEAVVNDIDQYMNTCILDAIKVKVSTLKRLDSSRRLLDSLLDSGFINIDYYREECKQIYDKQSNHEVIIKSIKTNIKSWITMSTLQRQLFVRKNVDKIVIDMHSLKVIKIKFNKL
ncbi:recombinase family protein [Erysipelothrix sp. HDW6B]|uniref:recombinase family protein n=1 Tax=Erysipelothrix TaxID=1647 RepID=UPI00135AEAEA|nr:MULTISPECIES: recombinase family protein [Erysipelothrix]QIK86334.1 recombinase family protein [Erysipelothrix sp. HDW6B]